MICLVINLNLVLVAIESIVQITLGGTYEILIAIDVEFDCRILYDKSVVIAIDSHYDLRASNSDGIMISHNVEVAILLVDGTVLIIVKKVHHYNNYIEQNPTNKNSLYKLGDSFILFVSASKLSC